MLSAYALARWHIKEQILQTAERLDCVTFVSCLACHLSRKDAAAWLSNAATRTPSPDLPLEGYIQSQSAISLDRLHKWLKDATWTNVGGKSHLSSAYNHFCEANDVYEYCNVGSHAVAVGGRPAKTKPSVRLDRCFHDHSFLCNNHNDVFFVI